MKHAKSRPSIVVRLYQTLLATHLLPSMLVTTMTAALAYGSGQRAGLWLLIAAVLFGQFCIGWTNDYLDRHRDRAAGRTNKPIVSGVVQAGTIRTLAIAAFIAALIFSFAYDAAASLVYIVALISALLYNFGLKNSVLSPLPYAVSFGLLPIYVGMGSEQPFIASGYIILAMVFWAIGVHVQNVIPDFEHDAKTGIKGAANYLSMFSATLLSGAALMVAVLTLSVTYIGSAPLYVWLLVGAFVAVSVVFIVVLLTKNMPFAFKTSIAMTGLASLLIMLSGPYMRP